MDDNHPVKLLLTALVLTLLTFCMIDCSCGHNRLCPGQVREHIYNPSYTSVSTETDANGNQVLKSECHDAEYKLLVLCQRPYHVAKIDVTVSNYARYRDGQTVTVKERIGRWTSIVYFSSIYGSRAEQEPSYGAGSKTTY